MKETALQPLNPREIQARVRAGASPDVVAAETGWPLDRVTRYAEPPLAERAFIAEQARRAEVRRSGGPVLLDDTVDAAMTAAGRSPSEVEWDAWRREDGRWVVTATAPGAVATWTYDVAGRSVHPLDDSARRLMGAAPNGTPNAGAPVREERPRLAAVPQEPVLDEPAADPRDTVLIPRPQETQPVHEPVREPVRAPMTEPAAKRGKGKRASVPSWDEILFGSPRDNDD